MTRAAGLIAALATDADNLFAVISAKTLNPKLRVAARAAEEEAERKMRQVGADSVFAPYTMTGMRHGAVAAEAACAAVSGLHDDASRVRSVSIEQVEVIGGSDLVGQEPGGTENRQRDEGHRFGDPAGQRRDDLQPVGGDGGGGQRFPDCHGRGGAVAPPGGPGDGSSVMKILSAEQMREVDRAAMEAGIPGLILMENAGCRVTEFLERTFAPLAGQRIVVVCGKGNNGGDGLVIARQLWTRFRPASLHVLLAAPGEEFQGDAATNWGTLRALGIAAEMQVTPEMRPATVVVDALLGTGLKGPAEGRALELIRAINSAFPLARSVSVDVPSGLHLAGESVRAGHTITFAAPKAELVLPPTCDRAGEMIVAPIGIPPALIENDAAHWLNLVEPAMFAELLRDRPKGRAQRHLQPRSRRRRRAGEGRRGGDGRRGGAARRGGASDGGDRCA